jgi:hypothetical protein
MSETSETLAFFTQYSTALKRVGIESGPCIVLSLEQTDFPIPQEVNMRGRHAALMIQMNQQTREHPQCKFARFMGGNLHITGDFPCDVVSLHTTACFVKETEPLTE